MAQTQRMRWSNTGANLIGSEPRGGSMLRSPVADAARPAAAPRPAAPATRPQDQDPVESGGLICRFASNGETGDFEATDPEGNPLAITHGEDGWLEIRHHPGSADEAEPFNVKDPVGDANIGAPGENRPGAAYAKGLAKTLAPTETTGDTTPQGIRQLSALMAAHYRRR